MTDKFEKKSLLTSLITALFQIVFEEDYNKAATTFGSQMASLLAIFGLTKMAGVFQKRLPHQKPKNKRNRSRHNGLKKYSRHKKRKNNRK